MKPLINTAISFVLASGLSPESTAATISLGPETTLISSSNACMGVGDSNSFSGAFPQLAVGDGNSFEVESAGLSVGWDNQLQDGSYGSAIVGMENQSKAPFSLVVGDYNTIDLNYLCWAPGSFISGSYNTIRHHQSAIVTGFSNELTFAGTNYNVGMGSLIAGAFNKVDTTCAWSLGINNNSSGYASATLGLGLSNPYHSSLVVGAYNKETPGAATTWVETSPAFVVGNGTMTSPSNAIETLKNGETTLANKSWSPENPLTTPAGGDSAAGRALVVNGHTVLNGQVIIAQAQGDISMGIYE